MRTIGIVVGLFAAVAYARLSTAAGLPPQVTDSSISEHELTLDFSESMLTWSGREAIAPISIEPRFDCNWVWSDDRRLFCESAYNEPGTRRASRYRVSIGRGLWTQQGVPLAAQTLAVESERPSVVADIVDWKDGLPLVDIGTNAAVTGEDLRAVLTATLGDGSRATLSVHPRPDRAPSSYRQWRIDFDPMPGNEQAMVLRIGPGLNTSEGELTGVQDEALLRARINEPFRLRLAACENSPALHDLRVAADLPSAIEIACPAGTPVHLEFSDALSPAALETLGAGLPAGLHLEPGMQPFYRGSGIGDFARRVGQYVRIVSDLPGRSASFELPANLSDMRGARLGHATRVTIAADDYLPRLDVTPARLLAPVNARAATRISALNQPPLLFEQQELGDSDGFAANQVEFAAARRNETVVRLPPEPGRDVRTHGGLIYGRVAARGGPGSGYYSVAYAAFNITASIAARQSIVWVTDWEHARPIANAKVEWLKGTSDPQRLLVLAIATTDAEGIATIELPGNEPASFVRITSAGRRAIFPLDASLQDDRRDDNTLRFSRDGLGEGERTAWGVTERPLYHPGDTVRYRLWSRRRHWNHLLASGVEAIKVILTSPNGEALPSHDATLDGFGSIAGEITLPSTMHDANYCLGIEGQARDATTGACFRVAGYHVNATWTELHADRELAFGGGNMVLDVHSGYYSGGPAVGASVDVRSLLSPKRIEQAYPRFAAFTFIDPFDGTAGASGETFTADTLLRRDLRTGADGHASTDIKLDNLDMLGRMDPPRLPIPFGTLELTASTTPSSKSIGSSATTTMRFSRYARFVGLKMDQWVLRGAEDPRLEAVVVDANGQPASDVPVEITIEEALSEVAGAPVQPLAPLARCELRSGKAQTCAFRAPHAGMFRFRAISADAAPTFLERHVTTTNPASAESGMDLVELAFADGHTPHGDTMQLLLQQPYAKARVLFVAEHGGVLAHWVRSVDGLATTIVLPIERSWVPGVTIRAIVLDAAGHAFGARATPITLAKTASVELPVSRSHNAPSVELSLDRNRVRAGDDIAATLHNTSSGRRQVTLAVVDDATRALVPESVGATDPLGQAWLGQLARWDVATWGSLGSWARSLGNSLSANPLLTSQPPWGQKLESILVSGSNVRATDLFFRSPAGDHSLGLPQSASSPGSATLRSRFSESAAWKTDLVLEAGAHETVTIRLPHNLTRWRVLAWSADADDDFGLAQATVEASLPIEVRADVPVRIFRGDVTMLAASVRNHSDAPVDIDVDLHAQGAGVDASKTWKLALAADAEQRVAVRARARASGRIDVQARAASATTSDGIANELDVASPIEHQRMPVAGWLPAAGVRLRLPEVPAGATNAHLRVEVGRGLLAHAAAWIDSLRDYPHRCWEQILSRAVGAAASKELGLADTRWKDADATVNDALAAAAQFQDDSGSFHFFAVNDVMAATRPDVYLTVYTVRALSFLQLLGYAIPGTITEKARTSLRSAIEQQTASSQDAAMQFAQDEEIVAAAAALAPETPLPPATTERLWNQRAKLSWFSRANLVRALAASSARDRATTELREAAPLRGGRRVIPGHSVSTSPFASHALDQCGVLDSLIEFDRSADARSAQVEYLRGLADLYAGGATTLDTRTASQCLMTLVRSARISNEPLRIEISADGVSADMDLTEGQAAAEWDSGTRTRMPATLAIRPAAANAGLASYVASVEYDIDGRHTESTATAFGLARHYSVLHDHAWNDVPATAIHEGDWVRVSLRLSNQAVRHFVAVTDTVAGGLQPTDLELTGVAGLDLRTLGGNGSPYFAARRVDDRFARFYAEQLPPGTHEVYYYARAAHPGRYAALPAVAELMYGSAGVARTASAVLDILEGKR